MAQKPDTARNASGMERVGKRKLGYNVAQVNDFLEHAHKLYDSDDAELTQQDIQDVSFDLERNGYVIGQVDAALSRLERAVVDKCTEHELSECGRVVWKARIEALYRKLLKHAQRDYRDRFDSGAPHRPSYARKQVDIMVDQALDKIAFMLGHELEWETDDDTLNGIDADYVSNVIFTQRTGKRGYDERQVDYYLNACVRLLSSLESFERVNDYVDSENSYSASHSSAKPLVRAAENTLVAPSFAPSAKNVAESLSAASAESAESKRDTESKLDDANNSADSKTTADSKTKDAKDVKHVVDLVDDSAAADVLPKISHTPSVPRVPDHNKQSIFAPVDYNNRASSDSFEVLHQSERAIFTPHAAAGNSSVSLDDTDSNDELLQSATVMHNSTESAKMPPAFPPVIRSNNEHSAKSESSAPSYPPSYPPTPARESASSRESASDIPSFPPAAPVKRSPLPVPPLTSAHFEPSKPLVLDVPDLSFPIISHIDESGAFDGDLNDVDDGNDGDSAK